MIYRFHADIVFEADSQGDALNKLVSFFAENFDGLEPNMILPYTGKMEVEEEKITPEVDLKKYEE